MSDIAIKVENLGKLYRIGEFVGYRTIRESLMTAFSAPFQHFRHSVTLGTESQNRDSEYIWALKNVSFTVKQGEVVGIIGRNGAGKTTILKILTRITEPTEGYAEIRGRVGSLLEVGSGFHPELTGRENVYLNGAVLGMKKKEIDRKFDEIVEFAGVEKFIDTPLKRHSSGMQVRLAFSVAAHLEPEILLVDEVLAVGDAEFQKKCLGKMEDVAKGGRTVLFVSHQLTSIRRLCERCIWLDSGNIRMDGATRQVVGAYEIAMSSEFGSPQATTEHRKNERAYFLGWEILSPKSSQPNVFTSYGSLSLKVFLQVNRPIKRGYGGIAIWNSEGQLMWSAATNDRGKGYFSLEPGRYEFIYTLPALPLKPGIYLLQLSLYDNFDGKLLDNWYSVPELIIETEPLAHYADEWQGVLNLPCDFKIMRSSNDG